MRPLELTLEGFKSHRARSTFDWRGRRLVGIVGPIGAGKSSVLDAMAFALYGKTPVVERDTRSLIHQLCDTCHVELRFEVEGQVWRTVRAIRRKGQSGHQLERLEADRPDAAAVETVTGEGAIRARVEQLLGLDFRGFCRSVLLAQNQFAELLRATPAERDKVLKAVFGFERLDEALRVAKSRVVRHQTELELLEERARDADEARAQLEVTREQEAGSKARLEELERAEPVAGLRASERDLAERERDEAARRDEELTRVAASLPRREEVESVAERAETARTAVEAAKAASERAEAASERAEAELRETQARVGDRERFRTFADLVRRHEAEAKTILDERGRVEEAGAKLDRARTAEEEAGAGLEEATFELERAAARLEEASAEREVREAALVEARHGEMALELRGALVLGDACPVCEQPVHALPKRPAAPKVAAASRTADKARVGEEGARAEKERRATALGRAETTLRAAHAAVEECAADRDRAADRAAAAEAALSAPKAELVERLGEGDPTELLGEREAQLAAAESALKHAGSVARAARSAYETARDTAEGSAEQLGRLAMKIAGAWGRLGRTRDVPRAPASLLEAYVELGRAVVQAHEVERAAIVDAQERVERAARDLAELLVGLGLAPDANLQHELVEARVAYGTAKQRVADLRQTIKAAGKVQEKIFDARARLDLATRLAKDLQPSGFLKFLLEEERAELAAVGSEHFERLTDGSYRFTDDGSFDVVDLNAASTERRADSLSGGETFLASLALALALAEMVARRGGRLDAFFLDEGFGGLDPEHLDRAMDGIEALVAGQANRLVVLVSHVAEMREAVEDLIVLDKHAITGDTVVVSGAAGPA